MSRIRLAIIRGLHQPSLSAGQHVTATRIFTRIGFGLAHGWTDLESVAIVDTGAPLSLFPQPMWAAIDRQVLATVAVGGLIQRPECRFSADLAVIRCVLSDGVITIGPYRMHALLAHDDRVPALLGLGGALEEAALSVNLRHDSAYLETT